MSDDRDDDDDELRLDYDTDSSLVIDIDVGGLRLRLERLSSEIARISLDRDGVHVPAESSGLRLICAKRVVPPCTGEWYITQSERYTMDLAASNRLLLTIEPLRQQRVVVLSN
jgi:hypothetical protein